MQDFHFKIAQLEVEYQGQTRCIRILDCQPFIVTHYFIEHRIELKCFLFA